MIKYSGNTINDWNFGDDNIIKVYRNNAVCYYKITGGGDTPTAQTPCFAVVDDISQYSDTEFEDVFNNADNKWYKLNNLNQYEEYGIYGSGRTITTYDGKLTIDTESTPQPPRLPDGYTEVEYIENTGTTSSNGAYINSGLKLYDVVGNSFSLSGRVKSEYYTASGYDDLETIINSESVSSPYYGFTYRYAHSSHILEFTNNPSGEVSFSSTANTDGTTSITISCNSTSVTDQVPLGLFASYNANYSTPYRFAKATMYSLTVVKNGVTVRDFVPAKRDSDDKYGLYDLITDTFYTSPNGNNFSGGSEVTPPPITKTYEYMYSGGSWVNVGEVSGSSKTSGFTIDDINNDVTVKSSISDGDYYVISYYKHNNPKEPQYMMSYQTSNNYLSNFSGYTGSNSITPNTVIDAAIWKFEATSTANTYYIKNIYNNLYWGYQTRASNRSLNLVADSSSSKAIVKVGVANSSTTVGFVEMNVNGSSYTYEDGTVGGYALNQLNGYTYRMNWWNTGGWGSDGNSAYYLYKIEGGTIVYPVEYDEMQDPPNNIIFSSMAEAEAYECPWVGMKATIAGDNYVFSGDSQSGYEWVYNPSRLPFGYTEVEYVENQNRSYLNTQFKPNQDTRIVAKIQCVTSTQYGRYIGAGGYNLKNAIQFDYENGAQGTLHISWGTQSSWSIYSSCVGDYNVHIYDWDKNYFYRDKGEPNEFSATTTYGTFQCTDNLGIFTFIQNGNPSAQYSTEYLFGRMYSLQIYDNGTLVRDLVPCIRDNDSTVGAYDIVNDVFYYPPNYASYPLIAGNPV